MKSLAQVSLEESNLCYHDVVIFRNCEQGSVQTGYVADQKEDFFFILQVFLAGFGTQIRTIL